jgi:aminopeptidase YwaD
MKPLRTIFLLITLAAPLWAQNPVSEEITADELREHVGYLASDALQGRRPGHPGCDEAAAYIRDQFRTAGLRLLYDDGYQAFPIVTGIVAGANCALNAADEEAKLAQDFMPLSFSAAATLEAPVRFAGYGFDYELDSSSWKDYDGLDVAGAWVLVLRGSPDDESGDFDPFTSLLKKAMVARDHGAAGVLFVAGPQFDKEDRPVELQYQQQESSMDIPVVSITRRVAERLLQGRHIADLEKELNATRGPLRVDCVGTVRATVVLEKKQVTARNVVAIVEGTDEALRGEFVVLGAHYDHLGMGGPGSGSRRPDTIAVHNGADDNASGTAVALEVGERIAVSGGLRRSVIIVAFTAEEMGLLGAKQFTRDPPVDLSSIALMCNLDMVGRFNDETNTMHVGGTGTAEGLEELLRGAAERTDILLATSPEGYGPSDHAAFYAENIPVLFFFTGINEEYHTPEDDVHLLNYPGAKRVADLVYEVVAAAANRDQALAFRESGPKSRPAASRRFKVTLGIMPDVSSSGGDGLRVDAVIADRPAALAGMLKGDVIIAMEGKKVNGVYEYMNRLADFSPGQRISVEVLRGGEKHLFIVEL